MAVVEVTRGRYKVRYRIGKKQYSKSGFQSKKDARAYEAEQLRRIRGGTWTDPTAARVSVDAIYQDWIAAKSASERTLSDYREIWKACIEGTWSSVRLQDVSPAAVTRWVSTLNEAYSAARARKAISVFSQIMDWAVADERLTVNPLSRAKALARGPLVAKRTTLPTKRYLDHSEVELLASNSGDYGLMVLVMAYTGVRFGEATALQARDIDLLRNRVLVRRAFTDIRGKLATVPPKSGKAREVPIPVLLRAKLQARLAELPHSESLLFTAKQGGPVRYSRWRSGHFNPACEASGAAGLTPHGLRHTYAALAVQAGANPKVLQQAMGHSDIRLTLDTYGGLFGDDLDALASGLDAAAAVAGPSAVAPNPAGMPLGNLRRRA